MSNELCTGCAVQQGAHKPAEAVHQIQEQSTSAKAQTEVERIAARMEFYCLGQKLDEEMRSAANLLRAQDSELSTLRAQLAGLTKQLKSEIEMASAGMRIHLALKSEHAALKAELEAKAQGVDVTRLHAEIMNISCAPIGLEPGFISVDYRCGHRDARHAAAELVLAAAPSPAVPAPDARDALDDTALLDFIQSESWDLRSMNIPTGAGDSEIHWQVIEHHMAAPHEREVGRAYIDDAREAVRDAVGRLTNIAAKAKGAQA